MKVERIVHDDDTRWDETIRIHLSNRDLAGILNNEARGKALGRIRVIVFHKEGMDNKDV